MASWATDHHRTGGACAEIVVLSRYFNLFPLRLGLPSPAGAKILTVGNQDKILGADPVVVKPCRDAVDGNGCMSTFGVIGMRWCGPGSRTDPLRIRDSALDTSNPTLECHGANTPPDFSSPQTTYASVVTNTTTYADTAAGIASIGSEELTGTAVVSGFRVNTDSVTVTSTSFQTQVVSRVSSTSVLSQQTGSIDASTVVGHPDKESDYCVQECVSAFKGCISGSDTEEVGSMYAMDCHAAAACYCTEPPYQTMSAPQAGSGPANPQDPATDPAMLSSRIDMTKVNELCTNVRIELSLSKSNAD